MTTERIDVLAVMLIAGEVAASNGLYETHDALYEARAAVAELISDIRQARGALSQNVTFPSDIALARTALDRAIARISVCNCPGYGKGWQEAHAPNCPERAALARVGAP